MSTVDFLYGSGTVGLDIPDKRYAGTLVSQLHDYVPEKDEVALVREAIENPIGRHRLSELARDKKNIVIISSDHTRPVPSHIIMPLLLEEIRSTSPDADITILVATGCHRVTTEAELMKKYGENICREERIIVHDCDDESRLLTIGRLPSGGDLVINSIAANADLLVAEGFIEPHFFAGFSGGRKSVLPGIASRKTVMYNHNAEFINDANARTGILEGNPIHRDMVYAGRAAKLAFICNVVLNSEKKIVYAVAGDMEKAHEAGVKFLRDKCQVAAVPADIVISTNGGYPLDQNVYQAVKGMTAAEANVRDGGVIIMMARSNDGHGGEGFYNTLKNEASADTIMNGYLKTPKYDTKVDQWQVQVFLRVLMKATVVYVSGMPDEMIKDMHMIPAHTLDEALAKADEILATKGIRDGSILAIPDGISVIVR